MDTPPSRRAVCPVCAEPPAGARPRPALCEHCGWQLFSPVRVGSAGPDELAGFTTRLRQAQGDHDLRAATVAAPRADRDPLAGLARLSAYARKDPGKGGAEAGDGPVTLTGPAVVLPDAAAELRGSEAHSRLSLLDVNVRGLTLFLAERGQPGLATLWSRSWHQVCPEVPAYRDKQLFQLAGGVGTQPVSRVHWRAAITRVCGELAPRIRPPLALIQPPPGWMLLETAAGVARDRLAPQTVLPSPGDEDLERLAGEIMAAVPRPEGYDALLAWYDPASRTARPRARPVFPPAVLVPGQTREAQVEVYGTGGDTVIPVLHHGAEPDDPTAAAGVLVLPLAPGERAVVTVRQEGPGSVRVSHPDARPAPGGWPALAADLPALLKVSPEPEPADVVLTVERGLYPGDRERTAVRERLEIARGAVELIAALAGPRLRVGVVGYGDHQRRNWPVEIVEHPLGDPVAAQLRLAEMTGTRAVSDLVAPLEDALAVATGFTWRPDARKLVLVLAGRPPHPPGQRMFLPACPAHHAIPGLIAALPAGTDVIPVLTGPMGDPRSPGGRAGREWAEQAWAQLSPRTPVMSEAHLLTLLEEVLGPVDRPRLALGAPLPP
ncbi:hypothetical protein [Actinoplanes sp. NPDC051851]|uniref:hypothetical protein n=1 Tax=Actinoplanes sp. NPDC051851 TaxID=3154753 RepID=UPI003444FF67